MPIRRREGWLAAPVGRQLVMMSAGKGNYIGLNEMGRRVWELIETPRELDELCAQLQREFQVAPEVCHAEVETYLAELVKQGVVAIDDP